MIKCIAVVTEDENGGIDTRLWPELLSPKEHCAAVLALLHSAASWAEALGYERATLLDIMKDRTLGECEAMPIVRDS